MEKKLKKKIKIHWFSILLLVLFLGGVCLFFSYLIKIPVKNIYIKGNSILTDLEIIEEAGLEDYPSYYTLLNNNIYKRLDKNPLIDKVKITRKIYPTIVIEIEEATPLFYKEEDQKLVLDNKKEISLERVTVARLVNHIPSDKYNAFINGLTKIDKDIRKMMSEIIYEPNDQDKDRFRIIMNDGNTVYLTLTKFKQMNYYNDVIVKLENKKGILYLDSGNHFQIIE